MFLSALIAGIMTVMASYYLNLKDLRPYLDSHLVIENQMITEIIKQRRSHHENIPHHFINKFRNTQFEYDYRHNSDLVHQIINSTFFQIQNLNGNVLYQNHSDTTPTSSLKPFKQGFSYQVINEKLYRIYSTQHVDLNVIVSTVQPHEIRQKLESDMVIKFVSIFLIIYLILSVTISIILRRALLLIDTAHELLNEKKTDPQSDITKKDLPIELQPFFESLSSLVSQLDQSLQREKRFAYDAAHELKTPLAALKTHLQIAQITTDTIKRKESLSKARQCINRSCHTIDQLLELVKTMPKSLNTDLEAINIIPILNDIQSDSAIITLQENGPLFALADPSSLMIILKILTENAVKFGATELNITTTNTKDFITLSCSDNGPGVPKEYLNRLGERFFRVYGTNVDGSGIGLNIASEIIKQMNGTLYFSENTPNGLCIHIGLRKPTSE
jgi:two-component system sensor histidine kinase QseC